MNRSTSIIAKPRVRTGFEGQDSAVADEKKRRFVFGGKDTLREAWNHALTLYDPNRSGNALARDEKAEVTFAFWVVQTLGRQPEPGDELRLPDTFDVMMNELRPASPETVRTATALVGKDAITLTINKERRQSMIAQARGSRGRPATAAALDAPGTGNRRVKLGERQMKIEPGVLLDKTLKEFARSYSKEKGDLVLQFQKLPTWPALRGRLSELLRTYPSLDELQEDIERLLEGFDQDASSGAYQLRKYLGGQYFTDALLTPMRGKVEALSHRLKNALAQLDDTRVVELLAEQVGYGRRMEQPLLQLFGLGDDDSIERLADARREGRSVRDELRALRDEHRPDSERIRDIAYDLLGRQEIFNTFPDLTRELLKKANHEDVSTDSAWPFESGYPNAAHEAVRRGIRWHDRSAEEWIFIATSVAASAVTVSVGAPFAAGLALKIGADIPQLLVSLAGADKAALLRSAGLASDEQMKQTRGAVITAYVLSKASGEIAGAKLKKTLDLVFKDSAIWKFMAEETLTGLAGFTTEQLYELVPPFMSFESIEGEMPTPSEALTQQREFIEAVLSARGVNMEELAFEKFGRLLANDEQRDAAITAFTATYGMDLLSMEPDAVETAFRTELKQVQKASVIASRRPK